MACDGTPFWDVLALIECLGKGWQTEEGTLPPAPLWAAAVLWFWLLPSRPVQSTPSHLLPLLGITVPPGGFPGITSCAQRLPRPRVLLGIERSLGEAVSGSGGDLQPSAGVLLTLLRTLGRGDELRGGVLQVLSAHGLPFQHCLLLLLTCCRLAF